MKLNYPGPNHTQTPNAFFDETLAGIDTLAEAKVTLAIIRQTFGWHKEQDVLSISQLEAMTGLSRKSVIAGVRAAIRRGTIGRRKSGQSFSYTLLVEKVNQKQLPSSTSASGEFTPVLVESLHPQKKETSSKENGDGREKQPTVFGLYESIMGYMVASSFEAEMLREIERAYPLDWIADAFKESVMNGVRKLKYADSILKRWRAEGRQAKQKPSTNKPNGIPVNYLEGWKP